MLAPPGRVTMAGCEDGEAGEGCVQSEVLIGGNCDHYPDKTALCDLVVFR